MVRPPSRAGHDNGGGDQFIEARPLCLSFGTLLAFATRSHGHAVASLLIVSLLAFLPGFFYVPPVDRDEARFAQATKQMIEFGDYVDIRFQDFSRYKKPVGVYWLQAASVQAGQAAGVPRALTRIWLYRIPSVLGAIGAVPRPDACGVIMARKQPAPEGA